MRRILPFILIVAGLFNVVTVVGELYTNTFQFRPVYLMAPLGWVAFGILLLYLYRTDKTKDAIIADKDRHIRSLGNLVQSHSTDISNLERTRDSLQERLQSTEFSRSTLERENNDKTVIIRRLNAMLQENGIEIGGANIPPSRGGELSSSRAARENPVPPPRMSDSLRQAQVVPRTSSRTNMASPSPAAAPTHSDDSGFLTGVVVGSMMHSDPAPARCAPEPSRDYGCESPRDSGGYDGGSSSSDSGGGGGGSD